MEVVNFSDMRFVKDVMFDDRKYGYYLIMI